MTDTDLPIACTLTPDEMAGRRALWERIDPAVLSRTGDHDGFRVAYRATETVELLLPSLAAAEADCCTFATWTVTRQTDSLVLAVTGPPEGIEALRHEFRIGAGDG